jgi:hypothetical protein
MANFLRSTGEHDRFHYGRLEQEAMILVPGSIVASSTAKQGTVDEKRAAKLS